MQDVPEREQDQLPVIPGHPCDRPGWVATLLDGTLYHYLPAGAKRGWIAKSPTGTWMWCRLGNGGRCCEGECMTREQAVVRVERTVQALDMEQAVEDVLGLTW